MLRSAFTCLSAATTPIWSGRTPGVVENVTTTLRASPPQVGSQKSAPGTRNLRKPLPSGLIVHRPGAGPRVQLAVANRITSEGARAAATAPLSGSASNAVATASGADRRLTTQETYAR